MAFRIEIRHTENWHATVIEALYHLALRRATGWLRKHIRENGEVTGERVGAA